VSETADALIVGGGIVGAACAEALSAEGMSVIQVESGVIAGGATAAGMGHIVVMDDNEPEFALTRYSCSLWNALAPQLPPSAEFDSCGTIWVAADEEEMDAVHRKAIAYNEQGVRAEVLDPHSLAEAEPHLSAGMAGGLLVPGDRVIYSPCAAAWLVQQAQRRGATVRTGCPVTAVRSDGVTLQDGSVLAGGITVCAAGTATSQLFPALDVRPRKGHLAITDRYPGFVRHQLVELGYLKSAHGHAAESVAFNVQPRKTGQLMIGSSRQYGTTDRGIDHALLSKMLRRAVEYMPQLAGLSIIRTWTGFRPATPDNLPVIGPCPGLPNVYLATGHEGLGITTSLGTAALMRDLVFGRTPAIDATSFLPARLWKEPS
jgi:glycine/D-amino acid oxidase-like deaminating enzyme